MKILHLDKVHESLENAFAAKGFENELDLTSSLEEVANKIKDYDGIVLRSRLPIKEEILSQAHKLKFIGRVGVGMEHIDMALAEQKGIKAFNSPEGNEDAVGEHTLGLIISLLRNIPKSHQEVCNEIWERNPNTGTELSGKTVGIIGYSYTGQAVAKRLSGFNTRVLYYDPREGLDNTYGTPVSLEKLQEEAQIVSLHVPLTKGTHYMVNTEFINKFKHPFYLINTARGFVVHTDSLVEGLKNNKVLGAGLDVLEYETGSFSQTNGAIDTEAPGFKHLIQDKRVILTPHLGGLTHESHEKMAKEICNKVFDLLDIERVY